MTDEEKLQNLRIKMLSIGKPTHLLRWSILDVNDNVRAVEIVREFWEQIVTELIAEESARFDKILQQVEGLVGKEEDV